MARARCPLPPDLHELRLNTATGFYEITEAGIKYEIPYVLLDNLKRHFSDNNTLAAWYLNLKPEDKKGVKRTGDLPQKDTGFYPDIEPLITF